MSLLEAQHPYLVGIKGVAQTALAQCLQDKGQSVRGADVAEDFVTADILEERGITIDQGFETTLPENTDYVIYTSAHRAQHNPVVQQARVQGIPTISHAEALGELFNTKKGIAVCGVGGKSTTSALLSWIFAQTTQNASYAIGVGNILGLNKTGFWSEKSEYFVAEADEYVTDPSAVSRGEEITPRFTYLKPSITICTNLKYDHPDVYRNFEHTKSVFRTFFNQLQPQGTLIYNADDTELAQLIEKVKQDRPDVTYLSFGLEPQASLYLKKFEYQPGKTIASAQYKDREITLQLSQPGVYNARNAAAAFLATQVAGLNESDVLTAITSFASTLRRSQYRGTFQAAVCFDDYAHHPSEVEQVILAIKQWYPEKKVLVAFQPHTFSRTQALLSEFASALQAADEIVLLKIFASARESDAQTISNADLVAAITALSSRVTISTVETLHELAATLQQRASAQTVILTLGAGDIYHVYDHLELEYDT